MFYSPNDEDSDLACFNIKTYDSEECGQETTNCTHKNTCVTVAVSYLCVGTVFKFLSIVLIGFVINSAASCNFGSSSSQVSLDMKTPKLVNNFTGTAWEQP